MDVTEFLVGCNCTSVWLLGQILQFRSKLPSIRDNILRGETLFNDNFQQTGVIAHLLAKIEMNEDRELLHNQYRDISQELHLKTDVLRKYRHKVKIMEKEISDIQSEFECERQDYLETIRKQERNNKLMSQISDKLVGTLKKECNYRYSRKV
ncbi:unnamed protein product [Diabrotica balteata]|uniref:Uncharacterized protein n=1 Tax=Diabrotica balteata TaxID=107213 RepID=A0A9N9XA53_DIABA|nr:unnamed protein product [Diabrotica balteata]